MWFVVYSIRESNKRTPYLLIKINNDREYEWLWNECDFPYFQNNYNVIPASTVASHTQYALVL